MTVVSLQPNNPHQQKKWLTVDHLPHKLSSCLVEEPKKGYLCRKIVSIVSCATHVILSYKTLDGLLTEDVKRQGPIKLRGLSILVKTLRRPLKNWS